MRKKCLNSEETEVFKEKYPVSSNQELAETFKMSVTTVKNYAFALSLKKSPLYLANVKRIASQIGIKARWKR